MQTLSDQEKQSRKAAYSREYCNKHNYMDCPGDTKMPEYSSEEIEDIESGMLLRDVAKKYGRSFCGVSDKKYRMSDAYKTPMQIEREKYRHVLQLKASGDWDFIHNCQKKNITITKINVTTNVSKKTNTMIDQFMNGSLSLEEFVKL